MTTRILRRRPYAWLLVALAPFAAARSNDLANVTANDPDALVVQDVTCAGNAHTSCDFIRKHLYLQAGQPLDEEQIRNAELRLRALRSFAAVSIHLEKGAERGAVVVVIEVEETSPIVMEWMLGASSREDSQRAGFAARIANQNLFGTGKLADLSVVALTPIGGDSFNEAYDVALRYADPQLFGSKRWFGSATARWRKRRFEDRYGNYGSLDLGQFELGMGWRIADFSYLSFVVTYRPDGDWTTGYWNSQGEFIVTQPESLLDYSAKLAYGWSTEDDLHFPTQGSTLQLTLGGDYEPSAPEGRQHFQFRKTWSMWGGYGSVKIGGDPNPEYRSSFGESQLFALGYARPVATGDEIRRGRWYVEPGFALKAYSSSGSQLYEYGLKAGFRAETRTFGLVDLYLLGTQESRH